MAQAIILDNGSGFCKAGLAGDDSPRAVFPSIVGTPRQNAFQVPLSKTDIHVGHGAVSQRDRLQLTHPVQRGVITDFDAMEKLWLHTFYDELSVTPQDRPLLLTSSPFSPPSHSQRILEITFEAFGCPSVYLALPSVLSLYSAGFTSGVVLESGDGLTYSVPIYESQPLHYAISSLPIAGQDLTQYLSQLLTGTDPDSDSALDETAVREIKEKLGRVAWNYATEVDRDADRKNGYELPDGTMMAVRSERLKCGEVLFRPELMGVQEQGVHHMLYNTIAKCDADIQVELRSHILLAGGTTMFTGFSNRLTKELRALDREAEIEIHAPDDRHISAWQGGSMLASLSTFDELSVKKSEFEEYGPSIVHRKCF